MNNVIKEDQVYRPREVARVLRVSAITVARAIRDGKLRAYRVGGQWRILGSDLSRYITTETRRALERTRGTPPPDD
jgi:excisionase family DNA binding protein